jgi:hypothetical protein
MKTHGFRAAVSSVVTVALAAVLSAQAPTPAKPAPSVQKPPTFRLQVDLVTNDVVIRDEKGNFIPDLKPEEFRVYEDGVLQELVPRG